MHLSLSLSFLQAVNPSGEGSATRVLLLHSARFPVSCAHVMHGCMYVCMYVYACMHACMYVCMHGCMYAWLYVCMHRACSG